MEKNEDVFFFMRVHDVTEERAKELINDLSNYRKEWRIFLDNFTANYIPRKQREDAAAAKRKKEEAEAKKAKKSALPTPRKSVKKTLNRLLDD